MEPSCECSRQIDGQAACLDLGLTLLETEIYGSGCITGGDIKSEFGFGCFMDRHLESGSGCDGQNMESGLVFWGVFLQMEVWNLPRQCHRCDDTQNGMRVNFPAVVMERLHSLFSQTHSDDIV